MVSCQYFEKEVPDEKELLEQELKKINWDEVDEFPSVLQCDTIKDAEIKKQCFFDYLTQTIQDRIGIDTLQILYPEMDTIEVKVTINPDASFDISVVDNPVIAGINTSAKVWKWQRLDTGDNQSWAGFWASLTNAVPAGYSKIEVKYLRTNATSQLRIKCEGSVTKEFDPVAPASKTNEWETIVFDLAANKVFFIDNY